MTRARDAAVEPLGIALLDRRRASIPSAVRAASRAPELPPPFAAHRARSILATGVGSSAAHARFLADVLARELGLPARFVATGSLERTPPPGSLRDALVVFSQGLSPNARLALSHARAFGALVVATARRAAEAGDERAKWLATLEASGAAIVDLDAPDEYGTLARVVGPMLGFAAALRIARSLARSIGCEPSALRALELDGELVASRIERADDALGAALESAAGDGAQPVPAELLDADVAFVASEGYGERASHAATKWLELSLRPPPPIWDASELAHGGLQQLFASRAEGRAAWVVHLSRGTPADAALAASMRASFGDDGPRLLELASEDAGPCAVFEHEALLNALLLRALRSRRVDPSDWPGRGRDAALYERSPAFAPHSQGALRSALAAAPELARERWPAFDAWLAGGPRVAVLALGSVEQHGSHLAFDTDLAIARWLAASVAARIEGAIALPAVPFGAAREHADFPGTLSLGDATFAGVVADLLRSVARHGFDGAFVFSAHGGNLGALRAEARQLREAASPAALVVCDDHAELARRLAALGAKEGISNDELGHHAGELETSIVRAIGGFAALADGLEPGVAGGGGDAQELFYPSLRANAPGGVVGDPRRFDPARGRAYLEAWSDFLVELYRARRAALRA